MQRAETLRSAQALILIWRELPALVGPAWPEVFPAVAALMRRVALEGDRQARDWAVIDLLELLEPYPAVLARLAEVRKILGLPTSLRGPGPIQPTPLPGWSEISAGLEHRLAPDFAERFTDIEVPERLPRGQRGTVTVRLTVEPVEESAVAAPLVVRLDQVVEVELLALSPDVRILGPSVRELEVPRAGDSPGVVFYIKGGRLGPEELRLLFRQDGRALGSVPFSLDIVGAAAAGSRMKLPPASFDLSGPYVPPPDLELLITTKKSHRKKDGLWFGFLLHSPSRLLPFHFRRRPWHFVEGSLAALRARLVAELDRVGRGKAGARFTQTLEPDEARRRLDAIGEKLFDDLLPAELQRDLTAVMASPARTLQLTTDEPWIPWELLKPRGKRVVEEVLLCERFELSRWIAGTLPQRGEVRVERLACIEAGKAGEHPLAGPPADRALLAALAEEQGVRDASLADATLPDVKTLLDDGALELWHFAAHGSRHLEDEAPGVIHLLRRTVLRPEDLDRQRQERVAAHRPLVFLNVCSAAQQGVALAGLGGWVNAWVEKAGASVFLAPLCTVDDTLAHLFAAAFYRALSAGATIAAAVRQARLATKKEREADPTWLAYSLYGHPNARVVWGCGPGHLLHSRIFTPRSKP